MTWSFSVWPILARLTVCLSISLARSMLWNHPCTCCFQGSDSRSLLVLVGPCTQYWVCTSARTFSLTLTNSIKLHKSLDDVIAAEGKLNFFQLNVDSPHVHMKSPFRHPVTGAIVTCGLSHPQFERAFLQRARSYIYHIKDLVEKLVVQLGLRMEQVRVKKKAYCCLVKKVKVVTNDSSNVNVICVP